MEAAAISPFVAWENFYVIVGSSAAALTGLQFVVIVLGAERRVGANENTTRAFGTPTIVHFCAVLLNSAILSAPWHRLFSAAVAIAAFGLVGAVYTLLVVRHARRQKEYVPVMEDWIWHTIIPSLAYLGFFVSGMLLPGDPSPCLFVIGTAALLLLFVGIHNAWDAVTYVAQARPRKPE